MEPVLEFVKLTENGPLPATIGAGDTHRYTLEIRHTADSTSSATDLRISDLLDPEIFWVDDSTVTTDCPGTLDINSPGAGSTGTVEFSLDELTLLTGRCEISYDVQASGTLSLPLVFPNTATLTWYSALETGVESRRGDLTASNRLVSVIDAALSKVVTGTSVPRTGDAALTPGVTDLAIGERVSYRLRVRRRYHQRRHVDRHL